VTVCFLGVLVFCFLRRNGTEPKEDFGQIILLLVNQIGSVPRILVTVVMNRVLVKIVLVKIIR
jgi:hypothetical protein